MPQQQERIRDLSDVPSFPAVYAAALAPRRGRRPSTLPDVAYRVRRVRIDPQRAAAFDHLMGGPATDRVHPGVLHVLAFPVALALMARGDFPLPLLGLVHLRNDLLQHRPVSVGELVDVEVRTRNLTAHPKGRTLEAVATIHDQDGRIIATDVSTYLAKDPSAPRGPRREFEPPMPTGRWSLPADTGRRYAEVSGDANPIHLSALTARAFGFPRAIAHGMYTASRAFTESRADLSRPLQWTVDFDAPVTLPSTVLVRHEDDRVTDSTHVVGWVPGRGEKGPRRAFVVDVTALV
ncbi:acyl dehydratase [Brachybacterium sp. EF45031]|uniref:MaoC family dehydratase n=1 Tax=Brachybacterium sillae TaxID=2810536 RepID=UPI00217DB95D|nr:MaoC/PaaZ C-terminal domain-containing protein [Brachybacterium sillae]MCS6711206.1 acyl dehydratase [Brachybacterium sillae]